mgnify:CR=1 FL=1
MSIGSIINSSNALFVLEIHVLRSFEKTISFLSKTGLKLALRDGALLSAVDGEYDKKELRILSSIAKHAGVDKVTMSKLFEWVESIWKSYNDSESILSI